MPGIYNFTDTWNAGGTTFEGIKLNVTDTASADASRLLNIQVGGVSKLAVTKLGVASLTTLSADAVGPGYDGYKARGTTAPAIITTGDALLSITGYGYDGSNYIQGAQIRLLSTGTIASTRVPGQIVFSTATDAAPGVLTDGMWFNNAQNLGIGITPSYRLHIKGTDTVQVIDAFSVVNGGTMLKLNAPTTTGTVYGTSIIGSTTTALSQYVQQNGNGSAQFYANVIGTGDAVQIFNKNGGQGWAIGLDQSASSSFKISGSTVLGTSDALTITSGLNVCIGTTAGTYALNVNQATGQCLDLIYNDSDGSPTNHASFAVSSGGDLTITPSGVLTTFASAATLFSGNMEVAAGASWYWTGRSKFRSPSDGVLTLLNNGETDFNRIQFAGTTSSFPSIKRSSTTLAFRLADDSADAPITASNGTFSGTTAASDTITGAVTIGNGSAFTSVSIGSGTVFAGGKISSVGTSVTLAASATTFAEASNVVVLTGNAGGNTLATITGGLSGQILTIIFVDGLVTITDDASGTANTINLSGAFTSSANDTMQLVFNGVSWREVSRSVN